MNWPLRICFLCAAMGLASATGGRAMTKDSPYLVIADRNVFKLQPVPPTVPPAQPTVPPRIAPKVVVTGITDICGKRQVLAEISEAGKPVVKALLTEGNQLGVVEVLQINIGAGTVKFRIQGEESMLALQSAQPSAELARPPVLAIRR